MKRFFILTTLAGLLMTGTQAQTIETATDAVKNMGLGWNLGNTLDANGQMKTTDVNNDAYWGCQGLESETYWGQKETKKELFTMMKNAGFGAIRVPVTWYNHMDKNGNVDAAWMARVRQVVDWVLDAGLYCIINVHHDTGADGDDRKSWLKANTTTYNKQKSRYENLWKQIATEFKDYDQRLLFESYNEMLDGYNSWCFASFNTAAKYDATVAADAYKAINNYAQSFVDAVRTVGGNNSQRNLIINTYGACCGEGTWNTHLPDPLKEMKLPSDPAKNHIIFEIHTYPNISSNNMTTIKAGVDQIIKTIKTNLTSKGAPAIFGEWGTSNVDAGDGKNDYDARRDIMLQFVEYFIKQTKANDMGTFYWMGLTDGTYRTYPAFNQPDLAERMAKAYHGSTFVGEYPEFQQPASIVFFEGTKALAWGDGIRIEPEVIKGAGEKCQIELTYVQTLASDDDIQLFYGNWSEKAHFIVDGRTYNADFGPSSVYKTGANTNHVTTISFPKADYDKIASLGLIIHGNGITLKKVVVSNPEAAGIETMHEGQAQTVTYNLSGQVVDKNYKGIVIRNGRKLIVR